MRKDENLIILVNATALNARGALTVLKEFLNEMVENEKYLEENNIKLYVLVSVEELITLQNDNLRILYCPKPKKNMLFKWWFENRTIKNMIQDLKINAYLSLQNVGLKGTDLKQYCLIHQPIPFSKLRANEIEIKNFIKYKILLNVFYKKNINYIDTIFVQTKWMKEAIISKYNYRGRVKVIVPPVKSIQNSNSKLSDDLADKFVNSNLKLLYVTNNEKYKNNINLIKAVEMYNQQSFSQISLYLTVDGDGSDCINYIGKVKYESIFSLYKSVDALIFPSLTETLGLPLLEAQEAGIDILAASEPYAYEICPEGTLFFNPRDIGSIVESLNSYVNRRRDKNPLLNEPMALFTSKGSYMNYIKLIHEDFLVK